MDYTSRPMRKLVFQYLLLPALCLGLVPTRVSAQTLLVVNQGDSDLSIVDPVSAREVATIAEKTTGVHGHEIAVSADGRTAFVPIWQLRTRKARYRWTRDARDRSAIAEDRRQHRFWS